MRLDEHHCGSFRFSTRDLAPSKRLPALREIFGEMVRLDFETEDDQPVLADMTVHVTPGLRRTRMVSPVSAHVVRSAPMLSDGEDSVCLILKSGGRLALTQRGVEGEARDGDGMLLMYRDTARISFSGLTYLAVRVPFTALGPLTADLEMATARRIPRDTEALRLLATYLLAMPPGFSDPKISHLTATHVYDLMALAIGATEEVRIRSGGIRAARLEAIRADLAENPALRLDQLAVRQGVTARYIQMLFENEGTSYSAFALELRLSAAQALLKSPRFDAWSVTSIALEAGFGDLSYFNRCFKRRFGKTPTDLRAEVRGHRMM